MNYSHNFTMSKQQNIFNPSGPVPVAFQSQPSPFIQTNQHQFSYHPIAQAFNGVLDMSQKNLKDVPPIDHKGVVELNLYGNNISNFIDLPASIENLNLAENKISLLPKGIKAARNLRVLNLTKNRLVSIEGIENCLHLCELYLAYNYLNDEQLKYIASLQELELLDLSHNHIKDSRNIAVIENLPRLKIFVNNMNEYNLISFKKASVALEQIHIDDNNVSLLEFVQPKISVNMLSARNNQLAQIKGLENLKNIEKVIFDNNQLINITSSDRLDNLKVLSANNNRLTGFNPPQSSFIEYIDLSSNQLTNLDFISECPHITHLRLSHNKINQIPRCSSYFTELVLLDLSHNAITELIGTERFPNLKALNLSYNSIFDVEKLLKELSKFEALERLDIRYNGFNADFNFETLIPPNVMSRSIEAIDKILNGTQKQSFSNYIKYRKRVISALPNSVVVLDLIDITKSEMKIAQKYLEVSLSNLDSSPEQNLFDPNISSPSEAVNTRRGKAAQQQVSYPQDVAPLETEIHPDDSVFLSMTPKQTLPEETYPDDRDKNLSYNDRPSVRERNAYSGQEIFDKNEKESSYKRKAEQTVSVSLNQQTFGNTSRTTQRDQGDMEQTRLKRDGEWEKVKESIKVSEKMVHDLEENEKKNGMKYRQDQKRYLDSDTNESKAKERGTIESKKGTESSSNRTELSLVNEITEELKKTYEQNLEGLKSKLMESLKKKKPKKNYSISETRQEIEEKNMRKSHTGQNTFDKEKRNVREHSEKKHSRDASSGKERLKESSGKIKLELFADLSHSRDLRGSQKSISKEYLRGSTGKRSRDPSNEKRGKKKHSREREQNSSFMGEVDDFLMEKLVEKIDNDKQMAENPYFQMYKEMVMKKKKARSTSQSTTNQPRESIYVEGPSRDITKNEKIERSQAEAVPRFSQKTYTSSVNQDIIEGVPRHSSRFDDTTAHSYSKLLRSSVKNEPTNVRGSQNASPKLLSSHRKTPSKRTTVGESTLQPFEHMTSTLNEPNVRFSIAERESQVEHHFPPSRQSVTIREDEPQHRLSHAKTSSHRNPRESVDVYAQKEVIVPREMIIQAFRNNLSKNETFIDCSCIGGVFVEIFQNTGLRVHDKAVWKLVQEIKDFMPRKLSEKGFLDLFDLPQTKEFLACFNGSVAVDMTMPLEFSPGHLNQSPELERNRSFSIDKNDSTLRSFSAITNNELSPVQSRLNDKSISHAGDHSFQLNRSIDAHNRSSLGHRDNSSALDQIGEHGQHLANNTSLRKSNYYHSLSSDTTDTQKHTYESTDPVKDSTPVQWNVIYGNELAEFFAKLLPYSLTPPRPVIGKETQNNMIKEIMPSTLEHLLLSTILGKFGYGLVRAVKTFSYNQFKKLEKTVEEKNLLRSMQYHSGTMSSKTYGDSSILGLKQSNSIQFYNRVLLFHCAKLDVLSELVENPNGFKEVYKEKPGDLVFSEKTHLCHRQYKRFMRKLEKNNQSKDDSNSSFLSRIHKKPRWRMLITQVFLGNCYLETELNFKEFAFEGELKVLELLKNGYTSIYFEKNEMYLVLLAENCVPVYLCEYQFEDDEQ